MKTLLSACSLAIASLFASTVHAEEPQRLSADIGGESFAADDDTIDLIPVAGSFTLVASTAGSSVYPPPTTRIDRLSIRCDADSLAAPLVLDNKAFEQAICNVTFSKGTKPMGGDPDLEYTLDKSHSGNRFEITAVRGKVIEGTFQFQLKDPAGAAISVGNGAFVAEDRQL